MNHVNKRIEKFINREPFIADTTKTLNKLKELAEKQKLKNHPFPNPAKLKISLNDFIKFFEEYKS